MPRYLVDVRCTLEIECDSPDDMAEAVRNVLDDISPLDLYSWKLDETFTVLEP